MTEVIRIVIVVVKESVNNRQGSGSKTTAPFPKTLINLDKEVIRVLLVRRMEMLYKGENRSRDCDYVRNLVSINKIPYALLDNHTFIIRDDPGIIRVSAGQILQIGRDKDTAPCAIGLTTDREVCICVFFLAAHDTLGWWWCCVFKFDNSLAHYWLERTE